MRNRNKQAAFGTLALVFTAHALAQQAPQPRDYYVGNTGVGLPVSPPAPGAQTPASPFAPASRNVRMFGALYSVESCSYDPVRDVIVAPSRGVRPGGARE